MTKGQQALAAYYAREALVRRQNRAARKAWAGQHNFDSPKWQQRGTVRRERAR